MPIGPSHGSRGGGGGRSFGGGGFSFGGGSRRSSNSRHDRRSSSSGSSLGGAIIGGLIYSAFADRRRRRFHNRYGYDPTPDEINSMPRRKSPTIFLILAIVVAFFSMMTMSIRSSIVKTAESYETRLAQMNEDYTQYYKPMFDKATESGTDGYYKTTATFTNSLGTVSKYTSYSDNPKTPGAYLDFIEDGFSYYFIVYEYVDARTGADCIGTTYTQFSSNQYLAPNGETGKIEIAYYSVAGEESYSMNTSYKPTTCAEFEHYEDIAEDNRESAKTFLLAFIVEVLIVAGLVALFVLKLKKHKKLVKQDEELLYQKRQAETQKAQAEAQEAQFDAQRKNRFCQYCGSQIDENSNICSGCGARASE